MSGAQEAREGEDLISLCTLVAGGKLFGIATRQIREVLERRRIDRVPLAPAFIGGVLAYRGEALTVVSLRALLGVRAVEESDCVLVLDGSEEEERFGLLVERVGGVVMLSRETMAPNPSTLDEASRLLFRGTYRTKQGLLVELDAERLRPVELAASGFFGGSFEL